jgi:hypothetical protein
VLAHDGRDVVGGTPIHPGRASPSVAPDPRPGVHQDRRVIDEVVQIIKPTVRIVGRPLMQLGLDSQYPRLGQLSRRPRSVGIHRRPPAIPQPPCELAAPLRHVDGFPALGLLRGLRPATTPSADDELSQRPTARQATGSVMAVPMFTANRLTGWASSCAPTASPRVRRRLSSRPPQQTSLISDGVASRLIDGRHALLPGPDPPGFEPVRDLRGFNHWFTCVTPLCLARRTPTIWQY